MKNKNVLTCKVVMLFADKAPKDCIGMLFKNENNVLSILDNLEDIIKANQWFGAKPQHLYLVSYEEIKKGDWYIHPTKGVTRWGTRVEDLVGFCKKIIASTDKSLGILVDSGTGILQESMPQIPESFIQAYVKAKGEIKEVNIEMLVSTQGSTKEELIKNEKLVVKTRSNNTAIIHQARLYSKEEVIVKMKQFKKDTELYGNTEFRKKYGNNLTYSEMEEKWIEENL